MNLNKERLRSLLKGYDFQPLFIEELGWDYFHSSIDVPVEGKTFPLEGIAQKRGLAVFVLTLPPDLPFPDYPTRRKIETKLAKSIHEHLIIFIDIIRSIQIWQWVKREPGKPASCREHTFHRNQSGDALLQKLEAIAFTLEEEERLTLPEVTGRTRTGFDVERVTKRFYERFKAEHAQFFNFIKGISDKADHEWYASVMLNRLMFVYFIQRKGFLDGDNEYLRNRLNRMRTEQGKDKFYSFYRYFLLRLFHEGLGGRSRSKELEKLIGKIPYLDGGIFDIHELERPDRYGKDIHIPDEAFEHIFDFFDQYQWHLDERPLRDDKEINPDVLGYIFEKYINQKQMGAYYTKEDITGYISKNTVIPFLFDAARAKCKVAFEKSGSAASAENPTVWDLLRTDPDHYIYKAVRHGVTWNFQSSHSNQGEPLGNPYELPEDITIGLNPSTLHQPVGEVASINDIETIRLRKNWNKAAPPEYALPTETWRELIARRKRYEEIKAKLAAGEVHQINDLITYNLDIRQFAQDMIENCEGPDLLRAIWQALEKISILDPTCGSGAFLFAALNILEPLYEACLCRMEAFVEDLERSGEKHRPEKFSDFRKVLARVAGHPNRPYFIFKSIILNNLYGVDIMEEAVEICKLRLFLKLAAQVDPDPVKPNLGIEPLPDIDFNIRAGNTLVGYATANEVRRVFKEELLGQYKLLLGETAENYAAFERNVADLQQTFDAFRSRQVEGDGSVPHEHKQELRKRLTALNEELNRYLAGEYGINKEIIPNKKKYQDAYTKWLKSHQPFHWFVEFYGIIQDHGGFDVIIGNPPYVEFKEVQKQYDVRGFETKECGDLYAFVMEQASKLLIKQGRNGLIVPVSLVSTDGFSSLRSFLRKTNIISWNLSFAERPSKLFTGVEKRLTIWLGQKGSSNSFNFLSNYRRWLKEERDFLFSQISFVLKTGDCELVGTAIPKIATSIETQVLKLLSNQRRLDSFFAKNSAHIIYYTRKLRYFVQYFDFIPSITDSHANHIEPSELKNIFVLSKVQKDSIIPILNSSIFFWFFCAYSDVRNVNRREIEAFRISIDTINERIIRDLWQLCKLLMKDFKGKSKLITNNYGKFGILTIQTFQPRQSKSLIDEIDCVLARHYGFTEEELDFIINYDIKYRMGRETDEEE